MSKNKELLFSVTAKDCDWSYYVGPGNGGQKKQKTKSGVICAHKPSGAQGRCHDDRMQLQNKKEAFVRMVNTDKFKTWHKIETARRMGELPKETPEQVVDRQMRYETIVEKQDGNGNWVKCSPDELTD